MCVGLHPTKFPKTRILAYLADPRLFSGKPRHVVWYQNQTVNQHDGANAMLLHFNGAVPLTESNFIPTSKFAFVMDDMVAALARDSGSRGSLSVKDKTIEPVRVFDVGIYTVALAENPAAIPSALGRVPEHKRPKVNQAVFDFYQRTLRGYSVALCCFNQNAKTEPLLVHYQPKDPNWLVAPGLDAHDGQPPRPVMVDVDETFLMFSAYNMRAGAEVNYSASVPDHVQPFLPKRVVGRQLTGKMWNGDYAISTIAAQSGQMGHITRIPAPGWPQR